MARNRRTFGRLRLLACTAAVVLFGHSEIRSQTTSILFVQSNWAAAATSTSAAVPYPAAQTAGNLNVVVVTWNDTTAQVQGVTDTTGNSYQRAIGPTTRSSAASQSIYYAINRTSVTGGANTVTVTFTAAAATPELRVAEYAGIDPLQPLDVTIGASANSASSSSGSVTTRNANNLLIGANWASSVTSSAGSGYTSRVITTAGDILEDRVVTAAGSYAATAPVSPSGPWIMQMAAFRAAGSPQPDLTLTKTHTGSFTQRQTGATYTLTVRNAGVWPTIGTVSVVDTLPAGLTATGLSGTGWTCTLSTVTCTRSSVLAAGSNYPAITLTVSVASNAPASVTNAAAVSGGGETNTANDGATDATTIIPAIPDLTLTKTHTGSFTQGQTAATYTLTVRNGGNGPTNGVVTVQDTLPAGLTATALSGSGWTCTLATLTCTRSSVLTAGSTYSAITLTVTVANTAAASLTNIATVSGGGETNTANDSVSDATTITQVADLTLTKTHTGGFIRGQSGATYALTVTNSGNGPTTGTVTVSDAVPSGLTATAIAGTGWTCTQPAGPCTRSDVLAAGAAYPSITLTVNVASNAPASVINTAAVSGGGEVVTNNDSASDATTIATAAAPDLALAKTHAGTFAQGQLGAMYALTVSNVGSGPTGGLVTVTDSVPAGLIATSAGGAGWSCTQPAGPCSRSDVLAAGSAYPAITLTVNVAGNAPASVTNIASVSVANDAVAANNTASDVTAIAQGSDLTVSVAHTGSFIEGQTGVAYSIVVSNVGTGVSTGQVTVADNLPAGLTATSLVGGGWTCSVAALTCSRTDVLGPGTAYPSITLLVDVARDAPPSVTNIVSVAGGGEFNTSNNSAQDVTAIVVVPDLILTSSHTGAFAQGQTGASYTLTVSNAGAATTSGVVSVTDIPPAGLTPTSLTGSGWTCDLATTTCTRADGLAPSAGYPQIDLVVDVALDAAPTVVNVAGVAGGGEFVTTNDTAHDVTSVTPPSDLVVSSTHVGSFALGQLGATYSLTVTNSGPGYASGAVTVTDVLPPGLTASALTGTGWTCALDTLTCTRSGGLVTGAAYPPITLTVNVGQDAAATVTNTVAVRGGGETNLDNDSASDQTTIAPPPDLTIAKSHTGSFTQGQTGATYSLTVTNTGGGPTSGLVFVTDILPGGLTATAISGSGWNCTFNTLTCTRSDVLAAGASYPVLTLRADVATSAPSSVTNTATVSGGGDLNAANNSAADPTAIAQLPDLTVGVAHNGSFTQGQSGAAYIVTVTNAGAGPTSSAVTVADTLPAGLSATSFDGSGWTCALGSLSCTRSDVLAAGASYPPITLTVDVALTAGASLTNTVSVSGGGETATSNDTAVDVTAVVQLPDLIVASTHTGPFVQGESAAYSLLVTNSGAGPSTGAVSVVDTLPGGLTASAVSGAGWSCLLASLTCTRTDALAPGTSYPPITLTVSVAADASSSVTNTAVVAGGGEANAANDTAADSTTILSAVDLVVANTHSGSFTQGQSGASYVLTVTNIGGASTAGVVTVVDTLSVGLTATAIAGAGWTCTLSTMSCTRSDVLTGGASYSAITVTVNVANNAPATVTNSATVSGGGDTNASNSTSSDPTSIVQLPDLTLSLVHGGTFTQGQTGATYVLSVTNVGASPTSGVVTVTDTLPSGLTRTGLAGNGWSCVLASLTCTRSDQLAAGASYPSITLTADIAMTAPASVTDTAVVSGGGESGSINNSASDVTTIVQLADLTVSVAHSGAFSRGQSGATYAITVNNSGAAPTAGTVTVSDALPAGLTATGLNGAGWTCTLATLTCLRGDPLGPGLGYPTITLTVDVASNAASALVNTATVAGGGEVNIANDAASDPTTIVSPPDLIVAKTHTGSFTQGQTGATYTITVTNAGAGSTTAAVAVSDLLPAGLTATALSGTGWTCSLATVACTRGDALAPAASFPNIVLTVNVSSTAPASVTNTATVSGGGELNTANDTSTDPTTIAVGAAPPVFVAETHFAVDQTFSAPNRANLSLNVSGTNNLLLLAFHMEFDGGDTNWSVQDNGIPGTLLVNTNGYTGGDGNQRFRIYYWVNPPTGNNSIVVQNSSTGDNEITVAVTLFGNVAQTNPIGAVTLDVSTTPRTSESETVAATPSDLVIHVIADAVLIRGTLGSGETSVSIANDGLQKLNGGDGDASLWISTKPGTAPTTTVSSSGWPSGPAPSPRVLNGVGLVLHGAGPDIQAPTAPGSLVATAISGSQINLSWTASTDNVGVTGYRIERCQGTGCATFAEIAVPSGTTTSFGDASVIAGAAYSYRVRATDAAGNISAYSNTSSVTTPVPDSQPPSAPGPLTAAAASSTVVNLNWTAATDNVGVVDYWVERCTGICPSTGFVKIATVAGTAFGDTGLAPGTTYSYVVMAEDAARNLGPSSNVAIVATPPTPPDTTPPSVPLNLVASGVTSSQLAVAWAASTDDVGVVGYYVYRDGAQVGTVSQPTYADTGLAPSTAYTYAVAAYDLAGNVSPLSAAVPVMTAPIVPPTPTLVQHVAGAMDNNFATGLVINLPNPAGAGNALILGLRFTSTGSVTSVTDDKGNTWLTGPTITNASQSIPTRMNLYYALNVAPGTQTITVALAGLGGPSGNYGFPQAVVSEFYNVASVSAFDGMSANGASRTAGTITTTAAGDLIYQWGVDVSATDANYGIQFNGSSITAGAGFTLLSADLQTGSADQYMVQTSAGPINPTFAASGSHTWSSVAIALKSAPAGTPPPLGIRIVHMQHSMVAWPGHTTPVSLAFPSSGNLLAGSFTGTVALIAGITDSNNNTWVSGGSTPGYPGGNPTSAQIFYAPNAITSSTLTSITLNLNPACSSGDCNVVLYDITGATPAPFDKAMTASGNQTTAGPVTMASLTPAAANELTLTVASINYHTINSAIGAGYVLDSQVNPFDDDYGQGGTKPSRLDMDNAFAHITTAAVSPVTFSFTATTRTPGGISYWGSVAAAFFGIPLAPDTVPPSVPVNLTGAGVSANQIALSWAPSSDNVGVAGYKIYRGGSQIGTSSSTTFNDTGLNAQTSYTYAVEAFDGAGNVSGQSAPVSASTTFPDVTPPSVPANLATSNVTASAATIAWTSSTDDFAVMGYQVFRNGIFLSNVTTSSYTDAGLLASTTYSYTVTAFDASGNVSVQSTPLNVTTASTPPTLPAFVKLQESLVTGNGNSISSGAFASPVAGGNLIAVWIWYNSSAQKVASMTDTAGNTYALAVGPTTGTGAMSGWRQELWYAKNIIGGANLNVTATFTGNFNAQKSITAHEYSGLDQVAPLDVTAAAATSVANASTGTSTTRFTNELIFAGALFQGSGGAGSGFTRRSSIASNVSEDRVVMTAGPYAGLFTNTAQSAIVQMVAFKAAGQ